MAHNPRAEQARPGFRQKAEINEGRLQHSARAGKNQVAMEQQRRSDADGRAVNCRYERLIAFDKVFKSACLVIIGIWILRMLRADRDPQVHEFLTGKIFPAQAHVLTIADLDTLLSARN